MPFQECDLKKIDQNPFFLWDDKWFLLTSGDFAKGHFNCMTVAWGSFGIMWRRPFAQIVVRPNRYTFEFTNQYPDFTLCVFPDQYRDALKILGSKSGRDGDKIKETDLTPIASNHVSAPGFAEAELIYECKKNYWQDFEPKNFIDERIEKLYSKDDYHRVYYGEIVGLFKSAE